MRSATMSLLRVRLWPLLGVLAFGALVGVGVAAVASRPAYEQAKERHVALLGELRDRRAGVGDVERTLQPFGADDLRECGYNLTGRLCAGAPTEGRTLVAVFTSPRERFLAVCQPAALLHFDATNSLDHVTMKDACFGP